MALSMALSSSLHTDFGSPCFLSQASQASFLFIERGIGSASSFHRPFIASISSFLITSSLLSLSSDAELFCFSSIVAIGTSSPFISFRCWLIILASVAYPSCCKESISFWQYLFALSVGVIISSKRGISLNVYLSLGFRSPCFSSQAIHSSISNVEA